MIDGDYRNCGNLSKWQTRQLQAQINEREQENKKPVSSFRFHSDYSKLQIVTRIRIMNPVSLIISGMFSAYWIHDTNTGYLFVIYYNRNEIETMRTGFYFLVPAH